MQLTRYGDGQLVIKRKVCYDFCCFTFYCVVNEGGGDKITRSDQYSIRLLK